MSRLVSISPDEISDNAIKLIGSEWMLIAAGTRESFNMMTASWGGLGMLWNWPVAYTFIRPQRYTRQFADKHDSFTLSFFDETMRDTLQVLGSRSGREIDKMHYPGLTPQATANGNVYFAEARLVLECTKVYQHDINPAQFLSREIEQWYPEKDYHRMYIGRIDWALARR